MTIKTSTSYGAQELGRVALSFVVHQFNKILRLVQIEAKPFCSSNLAAESSLFGYGKVPLEASLSECWPNQAGWVQ
jgi:hypothetical protein